MTNALNCAEQRTWRVTGASVPGNSHIEAGCGCDDAFAYSISPDGRSVVLAIADGAGSHSGTSALGSFAACEAVVSQADALVAAVAERTADSVLRQCFESARKAVDSCASRHGLQSRDLATTLAVAVLTPSSAAVAQVGDGIIVCEIDAQTESLIPEEKGEYVNEVTFLTSSNALDGHLRVHFIDESIARVALSTDGLRYKILSLQEGGAPFAPFFSAVWQAVADDSLSPAALENWLAGLVDDQTGDDKTLIVASLVDASLDESTLPLSLASSEPPLVDRISKSAP